jgi:hypothetical protein
MLSNLCMVEFDVEVEKIAIKHRLTYTRYADDLCLSTPDKGFGRPLASSVIRDVHAAMARHGLSPNSTKTKVCSPGSRKVVLGLLVDGNRPRLTREFRANLRRHIHYLLRAGVGPSKHASATGFESLRGMRKSHRGACVVCSASRSYVRRDMRGTAIGRCLAAVSNVTLG